MVDFKKLILSAAVIEISCLALVLLGNLREAIPLFLLFYFLAFGAYALAIPLWTREPQKGSMSSRVLVFGFLSALLFRVTLLVAPPSLSDDIYRYLWDSRVQLHGINPYAYPPAAEELEPLRGPDYEGINHKTLRTLYPPAAQLFFCA